MATDDVISRTPAPSAGTAETIELAALEVFYLKGYHGASIRAIAGEAGIGVATLFHHFPTKAAILERILHRAVDHMQADVDEAVAGAADPRDRLVRAVRALVVAHCERQRESFVAQSELRSLEPQAAADIRHKRRRVQAVFDDAVTDGVAAGDFHCERPRDVARAIVSIGTQVAVWYRPDGELSAAEVAQVNVDMALRLAGAAGGVARTAR